MAQLLDCPVCGRREIAPEDESCPNCSVDLSPLRRVRRLRERGGAFGGRASSSTLTAAPASRRRWLVIALALTTPLTLAAFTLLLLARGRVAALQSDLDVARSRAAELERGAVVHATTTASTERPLGGEASSLAGPGLVIEHRGADVLIGFEEPLFPSGSEFLTATAARTLDALAQRIAALENPPEIRIEGYADSKPVIPGGRWRDNWSLGLARATSVAAHLTQRSRVRAVALTVGSGSDSPNPFIGAGEVHTGKNRTVVLHVAAPVAR
jgi:outer membrane protein OmpA-like peptidoglycan-associated protein